MKTKDFLISIKIVWFLVIANFLLSIIGATSKIMHWEISQILLSIGLMFFFAGWIIVISDMIENKINNKPFWIMSMFILPTISPLFYTIQKNKI